VRRLSSDVIVPERQISPFVSEAGRVALDTGGSTEMQMLIVKAEFSTSA